MKTEFPEKVIIELEKLIDLNEIEKLVRRSSNEDGSQVNTEDGAVMVRHIPSGKEFISEKFSTQNENYSYALLQLLNYLKKEKKED